MKKDKEFLNPYIDIIPPLQKRLKGFRGNWNLEVETRQDTINFWKETRAMVRRFLKNEAVRDILLDIKKPVEDLDLSNWTNQGKNKGLTNEMIEEELLARIKTVPPWQPPANFSEWKKQRKKEGLTNKQIEEKLMTLSKTASFWEPTVNLSEWKKQRKKEGMTDEQMKEKLTALIKAASLQEAKTQDSKNRLMVVVILLPHKTDSHRQLDGSISFTISTLSCKEYLTQEKSSGPDNAEVNDRIILLTNHFKNIFGRPYYASTATLLNALPAECKKNWNAHEVRKRYERYKKKKDDHWKKRLEYKYNFIETQCQENLETTGFRYYKDFKPSPSFNFADLKFKSGRVYLKGRIVGICFQERSQGVYLPLGELIESILD